MRPVMENFAFELVDTARLMRREANKRAAMLGATRAQGGVLARLSRSGDGVRQIELADALDVEPITLCRMIDRLAEAGLVERRADEEDRRAWRIHLTVRSGPVVEELRGIAEQFLDDALAGVSEAEQARVRQILARVRANLAPAAEAQRRAS